MNHAILMTCTAKLAIYLGEREERKRKKNKVIERPVFLAFTVQFIPIVPLRGRGTRNNETGLILFPFIAQTSFLGILAKISVYRNVVDELGNLISKYKLIDNVLFFSLFFFLPRNRFVCAFISSFKKACCFSLNLLPM